MELSVEWVRSALVAMFERLACDFDLCSRLAAGNLSIIAKRFRIAEYHAEFQLPPVPNWVYSRVYSSVSARAELGILSGILKRECKG